MKHNGKSELRMRDEIEKLIVDWLKSDNENATYLAHQICVHQKAIEYAKFKHQDEYNDPIYHRDVLETLNDFEAGYKAAIKDCNNH